MIDFDSRSTSPGIPADRRSPTGDEPPDVTVRASHTSSAGRKATKAGIKREKETSSDDAPDPFASLVFSDTEADGRVGLRHKPKPASSSWKKTLSIAAPTIIPAALLGALIYFGAGPRIWNRTAPQRARVNPDAASARWPETSATAPSATKVADATNGKSSAPNAAHTDRIGTGTRGPSDESDKPPPGAAAARGASGHGGPPAGNAHRSPDSSTPTGVTADELGRPRADTPPPPMVKSRPVAEILSDLARFERQARRSQAASTEAGEQASRRKAELIGELYHADAENKRLPGLLIERWLALRDDPSIVKERAAAEALPKGDPRGDSAHYVAARLAIEDDSTDPAKASSAVETLAQRSSGRTSRVPELLVLLADRKIKDASERTDVYQRCLSGFPESAAARVAEARLAAIDADFFRSAVDPAEAAADPRIGKLFQFVFQDAVSGQPVSSAGLKGRVLVIDFWGTWCPPCVAEIPHLKAVNAKFGPSSVMIIGVNVDGPAERGGLKNLLSFVSDNQVPWPQFYQDGKNQFSNSWGVNAFPTVFVIDQSGRIVTTQGRGTLESLLPKLLENPVHKAAKVAPGNPRRRAQPSGSRRGGASPPKASSQKPRSAGAGP
jgi:thiol-disulfide isomerase/thioredoxin